MKIFFQCLLVSCLFMFATSGLVRSETNCDPIVSGLRADDPDLGAWATWHSNGICGQDIAIGVLSPYFPVMAQVNDLWSSGLLLLQNEQRAKWDGTTSSSRTSELVLMLHVAAPDAVIFLFRTEFQPSSSETILAASDWFTANGVDVIANLIAFPGFSETDINETRSVMRSTIEQNVLWLNTAGNFGNSFYESQFDDTKWARTGWHYFVGQGNGLLQIFPLSAGIVDVYADWSDDASIVLGAFADKEATQPYPGAEDAYNPELAPQRGLLRVQVTTTDPFYLVALDQMHGQERDIATFRLYVVNGVIDETIRADGNSIPQPNDEPDILTIGAFDDDRQLLRTSRAPALDKPELLANGGSIFSSSTEWGTGFALMRTAGTAALYWSQNVEQPAQTIRQRLLSSQVNDVFIPDSSPTNVLLSMPLVFILVAIILLLVAVFFMLRLRRRTRRPTINGTAIPSSSLSPKPLVFVSYSSKDRGFVLDLCKEIKWKLNSYDVWIDVERILGAQVWREEIQRALDAASVMLFIATPNSLASDQVEAEWNYFLNKRKMPVVTLISGSDFDDLPFHFHRLQVLTYSPKDREETVRQVVEALKTITSP